MCALPLLHVHDHVGAGNDGAIPASIEYDPFPPAGYQPEESKQQQRLSPWEKAQVLDMGMEPHNARAHLDTGDTL